MKRVGRYTRHGFTIIELIVVIVIIALLAAMTVGVYRGSQARARDSTRQNALTEIRSALESYRAEKGTYPPAAGASWEYSYTSAATFLDDLQPYMGTVPVDPTNDASHTFYYYRYAAGTNGWGATACASSRGDYYVLGVTGLESANGTSISPGWNCEDSTNPTITNTNWTTSTTRAAWGAFSL